VNDGRRWLLALVVLAAVVGVGLGLAVFGFMTQGS
jgi:hypothetical protein